MTGKERPARLFGGEEAQSKRETVRKKGGQEGQARSQGPTQTAFHRVWGTAGEHHGGSREVSPSPARSM